MTAVQTPQLNLFTTSDRARDRSRGTSPLAAAGDPVSSHLAAAEMRSSGRLDSQKREILAWLRAHGTAVTSMELAHAASIDRYIVARRLPDLERDRQVMRGAMRECEVSGRLAITWRAA
jgi:hypothetical protein